MMHDRKITLRRWRKEYRFQAQDLATVTDKSIHTVYAWLGLANSRVIPQEDLELIDEWLFRQEKIND
jgi:hypothetical protein